MKNELQCLKCGGEEFIDQQVRFNPKIKGSVIEVIVPCQVCKNCKNVLMNTAQMNLLRKTASDQ